MFQTGSQIIKHKDKIYCHEGKSLFIFNISTELLEERKFIDQGLFMVINDELVIYYPEKRSYISILTNTVMNTELPVNTCSVGNFGTAISSLFVTNHVVLNNHKFTYNQRASQQIGVLPFTKKDYLKLCISYNAHFRDDLGYKKQAFFAKMLSFDLTAEHVDKIARESAEISLTTNLNPVILDDGNFYAVDHDTDSLTNLETGAVEIKSLISYRILEETIDQYTLLYKNEMYRLKKKSMNKAPKKFSNNIFFASLPGSLYVCYASDLMENAFYVFESKEAFIAQDTKRAQIVRDYRHGNGQTWFKEVLGNESLRCYVYLIRHSQGAMVLCAKGDDISCWHFQTPMIERVTMALNQIKNWEYPGLVDYINELGLGIANYKPGLRDLRIESIRLVHNKIGYVYDPSIKQLIRFYSPHLADRNNIDELTDWISTGNIVYSSHPLPAEFKF